MEPKGARVAKASRQKIEQSFELEYFLVSRIFAILTADPGLIADE